MECVTNSSKDQDYIINLCKEKKRCPDEWYVYAIFAPPSMLFPSMLFWAYYGHHLCTDIGKRLRLKPSAAANTNEMANQACAQSMSDPSYTMSPSLCGLLPRVKRLDHVPAMHK